MKFVIWKQFAIAIIAAVGFQLTWHAFLACKLPGSGIARNIYFYLAPNGKTLSMIFDILLPAIIGGISLGWRSSQPHKALKTSETLLITSQVIFISVTINISLFVLWKLFGNIPNEAPPTIDYSSMVYWAWNIGVAFLFAGGCCQGALSNNSADEKP